MIARRLLLVGMFAALVLPGCGGGPKLVNVKGSVVSNGAPIQLGPMGSLQVILVPEVQQGDQYTTYPASPPDANGKFEVKDVPVGKYKVVINHMDPYPTNDVHKGAFTEQNTKFKFDIDGTKPIDIDVAK